MRSLGAIVLMVVVVVIVLEGVMELQQVASNHLNEK